MVSKAGVTERTVQEKVAQCKKMGETSDRRRHDMLATVKTLKSMKEENKEILEEKDLLKEEKEEQSCQGNV